MCHTEICNIFILTETCCHLFSVVYSYWAMAAPQVSLTSLNFLFPPSHLHFPLHISLRSPWIVFIFFRIVPIKVKCPGKICVSCLVSLNAQEKCFKSSFHTSFSMGYNDKNLWITPVFSWVCEESQILLTYFNILYELIFITFLDPMTCLDIIKVKWKDLE